MSTSSLSSPPRSVAIIGAGLGGLTLALSLAAHGVSVRMFELRNPDYDIGGAIMLSPNALRVLDHLGAYDRLKTKGFNFELLTFKNDADQKTTAIYHFGGKSQYGYKALRIYRKVIIGELRQMVLESGIPIAYGRKFSHVVSESDSGVTFALEDGSQHTADLLIGADGIHSAVRKYIHPDIKPAYTGFMGVSYAFPASKLRVPSNEQDYPLPINIQGKLGAFVMAPQDVNGTELFAGRQFKYEVESDRATWDALVRDKQKLAAMLQGGIEQWSDVVQSGLEQASTPEAHSLSIWPFHVVPKLDRWTSDTGRVIIVGDAAHAIPPTAGQGANQAFEDSYSLACLLNQVSPALDLSGSLKLWQSYRQERIAKVLALSSEMNQMRLAEGDKKDAGIPEMKKWTEMEWLYSNEIQEDLNNEIKKAEQK